MRSDTIKRGPDRCAHRRHLRAAGLLRTNADLDKPFVAVCSADAGGAPGRSTIREAALALGEALVAAGAVALEFALPAVDPIIAAGHSGSCYALPSRELVADAVESFAAGHCVDAIACIAGTDEALAGALMGAARLDLQMLVFPAGAAPAAPEPADADTLSNADGGSAIARACEALGVALPGSSTVVSASAERRSLAREGARELVRMTERGPGVRAVLTATAIDNALAIDAATGGSVNTLLHLLAIATHAGLDYPLARADRVSARVPQLVRLAPAWDGGRVWYPHDLHAAGGVPAVLRELSELPGALALDAPTVTGRTLGESVRGARTRDPRCIRAVGMPFAPRGAVRVLQGTLAPDGAVLLERTAESARVLVGRARVFDREGDAVAAIRGGAVGPGDVLVVRYEGPAGAPGLPELRQLEAAVRGAIRGPAAVVTDGRVDGATRVASVSLVSPEAARGGPIAFVRDGDAVVIDATRGTLDLEVSEAELERRRAGWKASVPAGSAWLARYGRLVASATRGAVLR